MFTTIRICNLKISLACIEQLRFLLHGLVENSNAIDNLTVSQKGWQEPRKILVILNPIFEMHMSTRLEKYSELTWHKTDFQELDLNISKFPRLLPTFNG